MQLSKEMVNQLTNIVGTAYIFTDEATRNEYGHDETEDYVFPPSVVMKPANALEIAEILNPSALPLLSSVKFTNASASKLLSYHFTIKVLPL